MPQFRHAHILLARLQTTLRDNHPELLNELKAAGIALSKLNEVLPEPHTYTYEGGAGDEDLKHLWGRRATFEYVMRRHVERLPHVTFLHSTRVEGLASTKTGAGLKVTGLEIVRDGKRETLSADVIVDASGKHTKSPEWLRAEGVAVEREGKSSDYVYVCRHYRLRAPDASPPRHGTGSNLDYLWYGIFYAEHGHFAVAFACPVQEKELSATIRSEEGFDAVCREIEVLRHWTSLADATSKVLGAGRFENRWFCYGARGGLELSGFFAVGDALAQTNPMYGRGCSASFVQAHALAEALAHSDDPGERVRRYEQRTRALLQQHFDFCMVGDRMYLARAQRQRGQGMPLRDRVIDYLYMHAWVPAMRHSLLVAMEFVKAMQMREISSMPLRMQMVVHILRAWVLSWFKKEKAPPLAIGPRREELLESLAAVRGTASE